MNNLYPSLKPQVDTLKMPDELLPAGDAATVCFPAASVFLVGLEKKREEQTAGDDEQKA